MNELALRRPAADVRLDGSDGPGISENSRLDNPTLFRTARSYFNDVLRDGQTTEAVAGADPLTGEVVRIDVTLTVVK